MCSSDLTGTLADGAHSFTTTATDPAGNTSQPSAPLVITVDTLPPAQPTLVSVSQDTGPSATDKVTSDTTLTLTGRAEAGSTVTVYDGTTVVGTAVADASGNYTVTTSTLADGNHPLSIKATDPAGNTSVALSAGTYTVDTSAPLAPTIATVGDDTGTPGYKITSDNTLTITGTAEPGSTVT